MTVTTSDADWDAICAERQQHLNEIYELRKLRDAHDAQWKALSRQAEAGARDAALWRSQFEDAQRMLEQLRVELGRERGLRVNAVAACKAAYAVHCRAECVSDTRDNGGHVECSCTEFHEVRAAIAEAERHG